MNLPLPLPQKKTESRTILTSQVRPLGAEDLTFSSKGPPPGSRAGANAGNWNTTAATLKKFQEARLALSVLNYLLSKSKFPKGFLLVEQALSDSSQWPAHHMQVPTLQLLLGKSEQWPTKPDWFLNPLTPPFPARVLPLVAKQLLLCFILELIPHQGMGGGGRDQVFLHSWLWRALVTKTLFNQILWSRNLLYLLRCLWSHSPSGMCISHVPPAKLLQPRTWGGSSPSHCFPCFGQPSLG